jgi:hypothetical protein
LNDERTRTKFAFSDATGLSFDRNLNDRGISNRVINKLMQQLFLETQALFTETLPDYLLQKLIPESAALFNIHFLRALKFCKSQIPLILKNCSYSVAINHEKQIQNTK